MTRQGRQVRARGLFWVGLLILAWGLTGHDPGALSQAASVSPADLIDKATLRVDLGSHHSAITAVAASRDGRFLATGGLDRVVRLWDSQTGELLRTLRPPSQDVGSEGRISALAFAPDGRHIAVAGSLRYWDAAEGRGSGVYLFDVSSGRLVRRLPGAPSSPEFDRGFRLVFSRDGSRLLFLSGKAGLMRLGGARLFELGSEPSAASESTGSDIAQSLFVDADFAPDGRAFLLNSSGLSVYAKDRIRSGEGKYTPLNIASGAASRTALGSYSVRVSPDGSRLAISFTERGRIEIRDSHSIKLLQSVDLAAQGDVGPSSIDWAPDGKSLIYAGNRSRLAQAPGGGVVLRVLIEKSPRAVPLWQGPADIESTQLLPDGSILVGSADASFTLLSPDGQVRLQQGSDALLPTDPTELYTDDTGARVWLRYGPKPGDSYGFALDQLVRESRLQLGKPVAERLHPPRIEVPAAHTLNGWRRATMVTLDGAALPIRGEEPHSLAVSPDGRSFVLGTSGALRRFAFERSAGTSDCLQPPSVTTGNLPSPCFETPLPARALAVNYSGDGRYLVAALSDGSLRWFSAGDGQPLVSFVLHRDRRRWVMFQPHGHYAATIAGASLVGWQVNPAQPQAATLFPLERFVAKLYNPPRVAASLPMVSDVVTAGDTPEPEERPLGHGTSTPQGSHTPARLPPGPRPGRMDPPKPVESVQLRGMLPPVATILSPSDGTTVSDGQVTLRVMVHSPVRQTIRGLRVLVNGRLDGKARGVVDIGSDAAGAGSAGAGAGSRGVEVYSVPVALPAGKSSIAVYAEGNVGASVPAVIHVSSTAGKDAVAAERPRLVVLAVGVGAYARPELQLTYPAKDANDLGRVLKELGGRLYSEVLVRVITDGEANLSGIRAGFTWLASKLQADDTALIFLAGHGVNEAGSGQYLFLPRDIDLTRLSQTGLSATELQRVLSSLPSRALLFLDTCHSGNVLSVRRGRSAAAEVPAPAMTAASGSATVSAGDDPGHQAGDVTRFVGDLAGVEQGLVVMAASTGRQLSQESPQWKNGAFTLALIEGLRGSADFRHTGRVTVNMLDLYVSERVRELTDGAQTPATAKPVTIPDFALITLR